MWQIKKSIKKGDYLYALVPDHPNATKNGYVLMHRIVVENHLGRLLESHEIVHHKNEDKHDNRIENLEVMTVDQHNKLHAKGRAYVLLRCPNCRGEFERERKNTHLIKGGNATFCSRSCTAKFYRNYKLGLYTLETLDANVIREFTK